MDQKQLIKEISRTAGLEESDASEFLESLCGLMEDSIAEGHTVSVPSFGNFEPKKRNERLISKPSAPGVKLLIPPKIVVNFKPSSSLKSKINQTEIADE